MRSLRRQRGLSWLGWIALLLVVGFAVTVAAKIVPAYFDYFNLVEIAQNVQQDPGLQDASMPKLRYAIRSRMRINNIGDLGRLHDLMNIQHVNGALVLDIDYEVRRHLLGNVDLVLHFQKRVGP